MRRAPLLLIVLALAACGGRSGPSIDAAVADALARQADAVAAAKDPCAARTHARTLQRRAIAATNAGRIPTVFQEPLLARVNELVSELELRCLPVPAKAAPAPPPAPAPTIRLPPRGPEHGRGHEREHAHAHAHEHEHGHAHGGGHER